MFPSLSSKEEAMQRTDLYRSVSVGGWLKYHHRRPASSKRQRKANTVPWVQQGHPIPWGYNRYNRSYFTFILNLPSSVCTFTGHTLTHTLFHFLHFER
jgi:hypothetical protein